MKHSPSLFLAFAILSSFASLLTPAPSAQALCVRPQEMGNWVNVDRNTRSITRAKIGFTCNDVVLIDENGNRVPSPDPYSLQLFGSCSPTDCDWGSVGATRNSGGWIRTNIDQGFAQRDVWVKAYSGDRLRIYISTDFRDPSRADYVSDNWFRRTP